MSTLSDEIIRLHHSGLNQREIAMGLSCHKSTVNKVLRRAELPPHPRTASGSKEAFVRVGTLLYGDAKVYLDRKYNAFHATREHLRGQAYSYGTRQVRL